MKRVILDLDNTIISSIPLEEIEWTDEIKKKMIQFEYYNVDDYYIMFERPHLQEFLTYLFENFKVSIWTAASLSYALFIVKNIITKNHPERKIEHIFFDYHCELSAKKYGDGSKHLRLLWDKFKLKEYKEDNTIIIDDLKDVYETQPCNCINIKEFEFNDKDSFQDEELVKLQGKLDLYKTSKERKCVTKIF